MQGTVLLFICCVLTASVLGEFTTTECGVSKGCYHFPSNCLPSSASCTFFSWKWNPVANNFEMELSGGTGTGTAYSAVAFAKERKMANADLYYCTGTQLISGAIVDEKDNPTDLNLADTPGVAVISSTTNNGVAECKFRRPASVTKPDISGSGVYDLSSGNFWLLFARGGVNAGVMQYHNTRGFSSTTVNMTAPLTTPQPTTVATSETNSPATGVRETNSPATGVRQLSASDCDATKGCFRYPSGCSINSPSCLFFSWFWNDTEKMFEMELSGGAGGSTYSAIAFGKQMKMADADLFYCTGTGFFTGAITTEKSRPTTLALTSYPGIQILSNTVSNGVAQCRFKRPESLTKPVTSGTDVFNLSSQNYWLLIAAGPYSGDLEIHTARAFSSATVDLRAFTGASGSGADILDKVHGSLMILAWLVLVNIGAVIARHFKPLYPNTKPCGEKAWFQMHRTLMLTTVTATLIAFIIIFVEVGKYDETIGPHAIIGIVVMVLALLNPIIALFRCHPGTKRRPIFNTVHWFVGFSARSLGIANLFLGVELSALNLPVYTTYVLGGFVGFIVLCEVIFEIMSWHYGHISYAKSKKEDTPVPDSTMGMEEPNVGVRGQEAKSFLLAVYVIGNVCFAISLWVDIGNA